MTNINVTVNTDRLFSKVRRYFGKPSDTIRECLQNAYRSYCPIAPAVSAGPLANWHKIQVETDADRVVITDYGRGIADFGTMLSLASSDWENDVEHDQDPAGMGVCGILAYAKKVTWTSTTGSVTVESERFFNDPEYRAGLMVDHTRTTEVGTCVDIMGYAHHVSLDPISLLFDCSLLVGVTVWHNGRRIEPRINASGSTRFAIPGYTSYLEYGKTSRDAHTLMAVWHGHLIETPQRMLCLSAFGATDTKTTDGGLCALLGQFTVVITDEAIVQPQLPDRHRFVQNPASDAFFDAVAAVLEAAVSTLLARKLTDEPDRTTFDKLWRYFPAITKASGWRKLKSSELSDQDDDIEDSTSYPFTPYITRDAKVIVDPDETVVLVIDANVPHRPGYQGICFDHEVRLCPGWFDRIFAVGGDTLVTDVNGAEEILWQGGEESHYCIIVVTLGAEGAIHEHDLFSGDRVDDVALWVAPLNEDLDLAAHAMSQADALRELQRIGATQVRGKWAASRNSDPTSTDATDILSPEPLETVKDTLNDVVAACAREATNSDSDNDADEIWDSWHGEWHAKINAMKASKSGTVLGLAQAIRAVKYLVPEWKDGTEHRITVTDTDFVIDGKTYRHAL